MVFNATFNNISVINGGGNRSTQRKTRPVINFITQCYIEYTSPLAGLESTAFVAICTGCTGSYKSNNHTITITTALGSYVYEERKLVGIFTTDHHLTPPENHRTPPNPENMKILLSVDWLVTCNKIVIVVIN